MTTLSPTDPDPREVAAITAAWNWLRENWEGAQDAPAEGSIGHVRAVAEAEASTRYLVQLKWLDPVHPDVNSSFLDVVLDEAGAVQTVAYVRSGPSRPRTHLGETEVAHGLLAARLYRRAGEGVGDGDPLERCLRLVWSGTAPGDEMKIAAGEALALLAFLQRVEPELRAMYEANEVGFDQVAFRHAYSRWLSGMTERADAEPRP